MVGSSFSNRPICARQAKWEHFKDAKSSGSRRQWGGQNFFLQWQGAIAHILSSRAFSRLQTFILFAGTFLPDEKCNRARDSELLNFVETARRGAWIDAEILAWNILSPSSHINVHAVLHLEGPICSEIDGYCIDVLRQKSRIYFACERIWNRYIFSTGILIKSPV